MTAAPPERPRDLPARDVIDRIGGPYAVTPLGLIIIALPSILPNIVYDSAVNGGSPTLWAMVGLAGTCLGGLVYLGLGALLLPRRPRRPRPLVALAVFAAAGVVRGVTIGGLSVLYGLAARPEWAFRIVGAAILGMCWFSLAAIIVDAWTRHRQAIDALQERRQTAAALLAAAEERIRQVREKVRDTLFTQVTAIAALLAAAIRDGNDPALVRGVATRMHDTVADVVRPLSHEVAADPMLPEPRQTRARLTVRQWSSSIVRDALTMDPYHPVITALVVTPSSIAAAVRSYGPVVGLFGAFVIGAIAWTVLHLARALQRDRSRRLAWMPAILVYAVLGAACAMVPVSAFILAGGTFLEGWRQGGQVLFLLVPLAAFGAALVAAEDRRRSIAELELEAAVAQEEWVTRRAQQEAWAASHLLARELHGGVQGDLTAAALRLEMWAQHPDPRALPGVLDQVSAAVERVQRLIADDLPGQPIDPAEAMAAIVRVWSGLADIRWTIEAPAEERLAVDQAAAASVIEVVRECLGNAMRHARPSRIDIVVRPAATWVAVGPAKPPRLAPYIAVEVEVTDNGRGLPPGGRAGLGSLLMDEVCLAWQRDNAETGTRVVATIAVATHFPSPSSERRYA
ncbi:MAG: sensor histidine kinase [bacterium]